MITTCIVPITQQVLPMKHVGIEIECYLNQ